MLFQTSVIYSRVDEQELTAENAERRREENVDDSPSLRSFAFSAVSLISRNVSFFQRIYHSPNRWETDFISNYLSFLELTAYRMIGRVSERRSVSTKPADWKVEIRPV